MTESPRPNGATPLPKRPYTRPVLTEYGSISKLTQSGGATRVESGVPSMKMNCL
ncbi:MAG: lasso RiPP family leader peptide-containing protein [Vicinamibacterales bacterium]